MKVEDIPIKADLTPQTDPRHQLNAAEVNALVNQTILNKVHIEDMRKGYKSMATRVTKIEELINGDIEKFQLDISRLDHSRL